MNLLTDLYTRKRVEWVLWWLAAKHTTCCVENRVRERCVWADEENYSASFKLKFTESLIMFLFYSIINFTCCFSFHTHAELAPLEGLIIIRREEIKLCMFGGIIINNRVCRYVCTRWGITAQFHRMMRPVVGKRAHKMREKSKLMRREIFHFPKFHFTK